MEESFVCRHISDSGINAAESPPLVPTRCHIRCEHRLDIDRPIRTARQVNQSPITGGHGEDQVPIPTYDCETAVRKSLLICDSTDVHRRDMESLASTTSSLRVSPTPTNRSSLPPSPLGSAESRTPSPIKLASGSLLMTSLLTDDVAGGVKRSRNDVTDFKENNASRGGNDVTRITYGHRYLNRRAPDNVYVDSPSTSSMAQQHILGVNFNQVSSSVSSSGPCLKPYWSNVVLSQAAVIDVRGPPDFRFSNTIGEAKRCIFACPTTEDCSATNVAFDFHSCVVSNPPPTTTPSASSRATTPGSVIVCPRCGRCRCEGCRSPLTGRGGRLRRPLPGVWCGPRCGLWTVIRAVECISCVCIVQTLDYHCSTAPIDAKPGASDIGVGEKKLRDSDEESITESPCSCRCSTAADRSSCRRRWACLVGIAAVGCLPCLLLYWPLRALAVAATTVYRSCAALTCRRRGCRCIQRPSFIVDVDSV